MFDRETNNIMLTDRKSVIMKTKKMMMELYRVVDI